MSPSRLISSVSLLAAASAAGYWLLSPPPENSRISSIAANHSPQETGRKTGRSIAGSAAQPSALPPTPGTSAAGRPSQFPAVNVPAGNSFRADSGSGDRRSARPSAPPRSLSREELKARAARVEQDANHELRRLVTLLDLSPEQQDQIFQTLASRSPHWVPGMATTTTPENAAPGSIRNSQTSPGSAQPPADAASQPAPAPATPTTTPSPEESDPLAAILPYLTPEQQEALITDEMDRAAWWEEMIPVLLPDEALPPVTATPDVKEFSGPDTLD
jgi:hypothetical protein